MTVENYACSLCRKRQAPLWICTACGQLVCDLCFREHAKTHYRPQLTLGGRPVSRHSSIWRNSPKKKPAPQEEQLAFVFPEKK